MQGKDYQDELARRRAARSRRDDATEDPTSEEDLPQLTWKDTLAMIIAAYQVLFPVVLALIGVLFVVWFIFAYLFS